MVCSNGLLKRVIEGKIEGTGDEEEDVGSYLMILKKREETRNLRGNTGSHCVVNWLCKGLWYCS